MQRTSQNMDVVINVIPEKTFDYALNPPTKRKCARCLKFVNANTVYTILIALAILSVIVLIFVTCQSYIKAMLIWLTYQDPFLVQFLFIVLFTLVSFPFLWGYMLLVLSSGYLFGILRGLGTVIVSANVGVAIAHYSIRAFHKKYPIVKLEKNEHAQAVLQVIAGPQAFKIVVFCRLSPIPFGLQNTIFALSSVTAKTFHLASFLGLLPAQCLATYLGSTLKSIEEVLTENEGSKTTGIVILTVQICAGIALLAYIVHKARKLLKEAFALQKASVNSTVTSIETISTIPDS